MKKKFYAKERLGTFLIYPEEMAMEYSIEEMDLGKIGSSQDEENFNRQILHCLWFLVTTQVERLFSRCMTLTLNDIDIILEEKIKTIKQSKVLEKNTINLKQASSQENKRADFLQIIRTNLKCPVTLYTFFNINLDFSEFEKGNENYLNLLDETYVSLLAILPLAVATKEKELFKSELYAFFNQVIILYKEKYPSSHASKNKRSEHLNNFLSEKIFLQTESSDKIPSFWLHTLRLKTYDLDGFIENLNNHLRKSGMSRDEKK